MLVLSQGMAMPHAACDAPNTVHFSVRHFAPGIGIAEDIATG
jgi:predicted PhzF superfamily epimerase YddE/YHI9